MITFALGFFVGVATAIVGMTVIALWFNEEMIAIVDDEEED